MKPVDEFWYGLGMTEADEVTFRDFAGALMANDEARAAAVLSALLGIDGAEARASTERFCGQMAACPEFMQKAMGMRQVVKTGDEAALTELVEQLFGLAPETARAAARSVLDRHR